MVGVFYLSTYLFLMRDAYKIQGEKIDYKDETWEIGNVYFVPGNPELYVELKNNGIFFNVMLKDVVNLITSITKPF
jgi:hypothetical protein